MKKIICALAMIAIIIAVGCGKAEANERPSEFICIEDRYNYMVLYHRRTKVMYAVSNSHNSYSKGVFTVLLNPDGTPMLWEE